MTSNSAIRRRGLMLVLSSPSGAGKSSIARAILESDAHIALSVSVTTRRPRPGEVDGKDYVFIDQATFDAMVASNDLLEYATVFDNSYGTPKTPVEEALRAGRDVLFDVDWQGTQQIRDNAREDLVAVFILPPSRHELDRRLRGRAQDSDDVIRGRMAKASAEMSHWPEYDYVIVNEDLDESIANVEAVLRAERHKRTRQTGLATFVKVMCAE